MGNLLKTPVVRVFLLEKAVKAQCYFNQEQYQMQYEILSSKIGWAVDSEYDDSDAADENLETKVNQKIAEGWKPLGGVSMILVQANDSNRFSTIMFSQAMVKE